MTSCHPCAQQGELVPTRHVTAFTELAPDAERDELALAVRAAYDAAR